MSHSASAALPIADPLARYRHTATDAAGRPIPLTGTRFSVRILGGLALVTAERRFVNAEAWSIEATLTFPVPLHAALVGLTARIDGRTLTGHARRSAAARERYEAGISEGRTAVLHEEVLRGVHMVSVGQVRPGGEVTVSGLFVVPLAAAPGGGATLRIPTTVGDIYGRSPLQDSDDLVHGPFVHEAELEVSCLDPGTSARLPEGRLEGGHGRVRLDAPIDIAVSGLALGVPLSGTSVEGCPVELTVAPAPSGDAGLNATWLLDISGSMDSPACWRAGTGSGPSKYEVALSAIADASNRFRATDRMELWEFSDRARLVGEATDPAGVRKLVRHVSPVQGGTEIGGAIAACTRGREAADILIVTDGKSYALDVHAAARSGARFTVVLVGEDALAANVGHLAALTGGQVFLSSGPDLPALVEMAVASMRAPRTAAVQVEPGRLPESAGACTGGMRVGARWLRDATEAPVAVPAEHARTVGAYAAWLALPGMEEADAAALAEAEGIVSHLTSLVLVDEAAEAQDAIPAQRKVALSTPRVMARIGPVACAAAPPGAASFRPMLRTATGFSGPVPRQPSAPTRSADLAPAEGLDMPAFLRRPSGSPGYRDHQPPGQRAPSAQPRRRNQEAVSPQPPRPKRAARAEEQVDLSAARARIRWGAEPERLRAGDVSGLPADVVAVLLSAAEVEGVKRLAAALGIPPVVVVLALLAQAQASWDNAARRFSRALLDPADPHALEACMRELGL
jgi:hypothetical protein